VPGLDMARVQPLRSYSMPQSKRPSYTRANTIDGDRTSVCDDVSSRAEFEDLVDALVNSNHGGQTSAHVLTTATRALGSCGGSRAWRVRSSETESPEQQWLRIGSDTQWAGSWFGKGTLHAEKHVSGSLLVRSARDSAGCSHTGGACRMHLRIRSSGGRIGTSVVRGERVVQSAARDRRSGRRRLSGRL
jgi:hypothetical protein